MEEDKLEVPNPRISKIFTKIIQVAKAVQKKTPKVFSSLDDSLQRMTYVLSKHKNLRTKSELV